MLFECIDPVKIRLLQNLPYFFQRKSQLAEKQDLLQGLRCIIVIHPISGGSKLTWLEQPDLIVVLKRPYAYPCKFGDLAYTSHGMDPFILGKNGTNRFNLFATPRKEYSIT